MRKLRRNRNKRQKKLIIGGMASLLCIMTAGYAAFSTNITLNTKGNVKEYNRTLLSTYITSLKTNGDTSLIYDGTTDNNLRYSGGTVNNYVCMANEKPCTDDNLYRIIGVFNNIKTTENGSGQTRVKLIRAVKIGDDYWNSAAENNNWASPSTLNTTLNNLSIASNTLIDNAVWNLGGNKNTLASPSEFYAYERGNTGSGASPTTLTWIGKIALMYPSDYGYASSGCDASTRHLGGASLGYGDDYSDSVCTESNWLFGSTGSGSLHHWFLTPYTIITNRAFILRGDGDVGYGVVNSHQLGVRPSFYLKTNVNVIENGNNGSLSKPYILELGSNN